MSDLISRQAAIDDIKAIYEYHDTVTEDRIIDHLKRLPSAQPERKKGKWIPQDHNKTNGIASTLVYYYPKCSVCGHCGNYTNFCPNCGAKMDEEVERRKKYE